MRRVSKVTISIPGELLAAIEQGRRLRGESRSEYICHALQDLLRREQEREAVAQYVRSYREQPETDAEVQAIDATGSTILALEPWD